MPTVWPGIWTCRVRLIAQPLFKRDTSYLRDMLSRRWSLWESLVWNDPLRIDWDIRWRSRPCRGMISCVYSDRPTWRRKYTGPAFPPHYSASFQGIDTKFAGHIVQNTGFLEPFRSWRYVENSPSNWVPTGARIYVFKRSKMPSFRPGDRIWSHYTSTRSCQAISPTHAHTTHAILTYIKTYTRKKIERNLPSHGIFISFL